MSIEVGPFHENEYIDLMILMYSRWKKIFINAAWHNTYNSKFANELFPNLVSGP